MRFFRILILCVCLLATLPTRAQEMPNAGMNWYGDTLVVWLPPSFLIPYNIPGTRPWYKTNDWAPIPAAGPPGFALSETSSFYNSGLAVWRVMIVIWLLMTMLHKLYDAMTGALDGHWNMIGETKGFESAGRQS